MWHRTQCSCEWSKLFYHFLLTVWEHGVHAVPKVICGSHDVLVQLLNMVAEYCAYVVLRLLSTFLPLTDTFGSDFGHVSN